MSAFYGRPSAIPDNFIKVELAQPFPVSSASDCPFGPVNHEISGFMNATVSVNHFLLTKNLIDLSN
jgi:hypothetical protein